VPTFTAGDKGKLVAAAVADATSGPAAAVVTASADTRVAGSATVPLKGVDRAGLSATALCRYEVAPLVLCGQDITVLDIVGALKSVRVAGVALGKYAGQTVTIYAGSEEVGTAKVAPDGSFAATVRPPSKAQRSTVRYQAAIGTVRSPALKLERKLRITGRQGLKVTGRIDVPRRLLPKRITFYRKLTCTQQKVFTTVKVRRNGTFTVTLARPVAPEAYALFRVSAKLGKGRTYTLPIAVR
jgi:hypothetical protein